jgi:hypothetical protein
LDNRIRELLAAELGMEERQQSLIKAVNIFF